MNNGFVSVGCRLHHFALVCRVLWCRRGPPRCVRDMPALLRVVKSRLFLALRWKGKRKCRPTPQMRNGASTTSLVRMFSMHSTRHLSSHARSTAGKRGCRWGAAAAVVPRWRRAVARWTWVVRSGLVWRRFASPDHAPTTRDR